MCIKRILAAISILSIFAIALFIFPIMNQPVRAEQTKASGYQSLSISMQEAKSFMKTSQRITASDAVIAQYFGKTIVDKILAQPGCVSVRMYYGQHTNGKPGVLIVGVDAYGKDMVSGILALPTMVCPPWCDGI
jgi:hypothetical protein